MSEPLNPGALPVRFGVNATQTFNAWIGKPEVAGTAEAIAAGLAPAAWQRLSAGEGTKGPRFYD